MKILNLEPEDYSPKAMALLRQSCTVDEIAMTRHELLKGIAGYQGLITRLGHKIDAEVLARATDLRVIVTATTGLNHIDTEIATARGIAVLCLRGERAFLDGIFGTSEHTMALILSLLRNIPAAHRDVVGGQWERNDFKGMELSGKTLGIYGFGRLGSKVAQFARCFGMTVLAHDTLLFENNDDVTFVDRDALLRQSDILSLHVLYTPETHHLIDHEAFAQMKPGAIFINTARGEIVDETALLAALESGHLRAAALDVMQNENSANADWLQSDPLLAYARRHDNLLLTPHIGGATYESMEKTEIFMAEKLLRWPQNRV